MKLHLLDDWIFWLYFSGWGLLDSYQVSSNKMYQILCVNLIQLNEQNMDSKTNLFV